VRRPSQRAFQQLDIGLRAYAAFYELEQLAEHVSGCGGEDLGLGTCIRDGLRQRLPVDGARVRVPELGARDVVRTGGDGGVDDCSCLVQAAQAHRDAVVGGVAPSALAMAALGRDLRGLNVLSSDSDLLERREYPLHRGRVRGESISGGLTLARDTEVEAPTSGVASVAPTPVTVIVGCILGGTLATLYPESLSGRSRAIAAAGAGGKGRRGSRTPVPGGASGGCSGGETFVSARTDGLGEGCWARFSRFRSRLRLFARFVPTAEA